MLNTGIQLPSTQPVQSKSVRRRLEIIGWMGVLLLLITLGGNVGSASWLAHLALTAFGGIATVLVAITVFPPIEQPRLVIRTALDWGWFALVLVTLGSALLGDARRDIEAWVFPFALQLPLFYGIIALRRRGIATENWLRALLIITAAVSVWAVWLMFNASRQWIGLHPPAQFAVSSSFRLFAILDNPNVLGAFLAMSIPAALGYAAWTPSLGGRVIVIPWLILVGAVLIATGSRGGQAAALVGSAAALVLIMRPGRLRHWTNQRRSRKVIVGALAAVILVGLVGLLVLESGTLRGLTSTVRRVALWQTALTAARANAVLGVGMGDFPVAQLQHQSVPPIGIERHAHNLYFNVLAESGLLGLGALALWIALLARATRQAWRTAVPSQRALIGGLAGALIAFGTVGLVDDPLAQAAPLCVAVMLTALLLPLPLTPAPDAQPRVPAREGRESSGSLLARMVAPGVGDKALLLTSIGICVAAVILTIQYASLWMGEQVGADTLDQWQTSAQGLDQAAAGDPADALVQAQAGVAWAHVAALGGINGAVDDALDRAIAYYRIVVRLDPGSAIHHLNLGALLMRRRQYADALPELAQAANRAPDSPVMHLNYGIGLEQNGQMEQAISEYDRALALDARWQDALFWQATATRKMAWQIVTQSPGSDSQTARFLAALQSGDAALEAEHTAGAATAYAQAYTFAPDDTARAVAGGMFAESQGDDAGARYDLQSALTLGGEDATRAHLYLGDLDAAQNDLNGMLAEYLTAFQRIDRYGVFGPGSAADFIYAVNTFGRDGYIADYLPGVTLLDLTPDMATRFVSLAKAHVSAGDTQSAVYIYRRILAANPGYGPAESGLAALGMGITP